jgi:type I restriction enzyme R subunit
VIDDEETKKRFLADYGIFARLYKLLRAHQAGIAVAEDEEFFRKVAGAVVKIAPPVGQVSKETEQAVKHFVSEGLSAGDVIDVFELGADGRPEISVLSDEFLGRVTKDLAAQPVLGVEVLKKILSDEIRVREHTNRMQAKLFSDRLDEALARYETRQLTSGQIIERLVELAREMREARRRHEALELTVEEAAFYDALAGGSDDWTADPKLAEIARDLVRSIKADLTVDWADHESTEAAIRTKIKHLLRRYRYMPPSRAGGGPQPKEIADLILEQARELYRFWPEVYSSELPL